MAPPLQTKSNAVFRDPNLKKWNLCRKQGSPHPEVRKAIFGALPEDYDIANPSSGTLMQPEKLQEIFPNLTHLYLWNLDGVEQLPPLSSKITNLEIRYFRQLKKIEDLPSKLTYLDISDCPLLIEIESSKKLSKLQRLYLHRLTNFPGDEFSAFWKQISSSPLDYSSLEECPQLTSIRKLPGAKLKYLSLKSCERLNIEENVANPSHPSPFRFKAHFPKLTFLDLQGCLSLTHIPSLPPSLTQLYLYGCNKSPDQVPTFLGQTPTPSDLGEEVDDNVLEHFRFRERFQNGLSLIAHSKILFLGNGGAGKTNLSKSLLRSLPSHLTKHDESLEFDPDSEPTHKINFWTWPIQFQLQEKILKDYQTYYRATHPKQGVPENSDLQGDIRIWDFGGQDFYHGTHRLFAREGSIFIIVFNPDYRPRPTPSDFSAEEWAENNTQYSLDYWIDYVHSVVPNPEIALVYPYQDAQSDLPNWKPSAPRNAKKNCRTFYIDCRPDNAHESDEYKHLIEWIKEKSELMAHQLGPIQPSFILHVCAFLNQLLTENNDNHLENLDCEHTYKTFSDWFEAVENYVLSKPEEERYSFDKADLLEVTRYLHRVGYLYLIQTEDEYFVVIDQSWVTEAVYIPFKARGPIYKGIIDNGGIISRDLLIKALKGTNTEKQILLDFMIQSKILAPLPKPSSDASEEKFLVAEKSLLPSFEKDNIKDRVHLKFNQAQTSIKQPSEVVLNFQDGKVSTFEYIDFQTTLARLFGEEGIFFKFGLQIVTTFGRFKQALARDRELDKLARALTDDTPLCLRAAWHPSDEHLFLGNLNLYLLCEAQNKTDAQKILTQWVQALDGVVPDLGYSRLDIRQPTDSECGDLFFFINTDRMPDKFSEGMNKEVGSSKDANEAIGPSHQPVSEQKNTSQQPSSHTASDAVPQPMPAQEPVVVLITVNDHETDALLDTFLGPGRVPEMVSRGDVTYNLLGRHGGVQVIHSICEMGTGGIGGSQQRTGDAIEHWQPRAVIAVGIAFGMDETKQEIGEVLVSVQLQDYELGRQNKDGSITPRGDKPHAADKLVNRFKQTNNNYRRRKSNWPKIQFGLVLSGQKLVDNLDYRESLKKLYSEAIGGEMEGTGLYASAHQAGVDWLMVKAICDWGHNKNQAYKDTWQKMAAANAARVVKASLDVGDLYSP